ncbi:hypothetical protein FTO70_17075 [Methanosarcina sp. KYL-1]|uniref:hypothetical protein n=1 Tax=Methanosarcina sp. KYL-1 TaxID=2602068 RepID=UPI0021011CAD|nr:hypothetical protein [Methanosarcina sp. KYL-1]MCQ1537350.1 hypothetical protein [Methanosarcina sp. KYL-1]
MARMQVNYLPVRLKKKAKIKKRSLKKENERLKKEKERLKKKREVKGKLNCIQVLKIKDAIQGIPEWFGFNR